MTLNKVFFKARVVKKNDVLAEPNKYKHLICFEVDPEFWWAVVNFGKANDLTRLAVKLENWDKGFTEQARRFYFEVRDRLAEVSGDTSREYKQHLHEQAKHECGFVNEDGSTKSFNELNKREVWFLTELMLRWAEEAGAYIDDLIPLYRRMGNESNRL